MNKILYRFIGKLKYQRHFNWLYRLSVEGMNYGGGSYYEDSGEFFAAKYVNSKVSGSYTFINIFDVGANIGDYALEIADIFKEKRCKIHSFEPSFKTFDALRKNTSQVDRITVNNFGFSNKVHKALLYSNKDASELASVYKRNLSHFGLSLDKTEEIQLTTIDQYCAEKFLEEIHFLKLDIEGHELFALQGALNMIKNRKVRFIQFEFGGCNIDSRTYFQDFWYMLKDQYQFYRIVKDGLFPITEYRESLEIFTTVNYLLELN